MHSLCHYELPQDLASVGMAQENGTCNVNQRRIFPQTVEWTVDRFCIKFVKRGRGDGPCVGQLQWLELCATNLCNSKEKLFRFLATLSRGIVALKHISSHGMYTGVIYETKCVDIFYIKSYDVLCADQTKGPAARSRKTCTSMAAIQFLVFVVWVHLNV